MIPALLAQPPIIAPNPVANIQDIRRQEAFKFRFNETKAILDRFETWQDPTTNIWRGWIREIKPLLEARHVGDYFALYVPLLCRILSEKENGESVVFNEDPFVDQYNFIYNKKQLCVLLTPFLKRREIPIGAIREGEREALQFKPHEPIREVVELWGRDLIPLNHEQPPLYKERVEIPYEELSDEDLYLCDLFLEGQPLPPQEEAEIPLEPNPRIRAMQERFYQQYGEPIEVARAAIQDNGQWIERAGDIERDWEARRVEQEANLQGVRDRIQALDERIEGLEERLDQNRENMAEAEREAIQVELAHSKIEKLILERKFNWKKFLINMAIGIGVGLLGGVLTVCTCGIGTAAVAMFVGGVAMGVYNGTKKEPNKKDL